jgi:hypothetical protein
LSRTLLKRSNQLSGNRYKNHAGHRVRGSRLLLPHGKVVHERQDFLRNTDILARIALLGEPSLQFDCLLVLGWNDDDDQLAGM